jgi:alpha-tubulin suppressor-like RCC1 family protein
VSTTGQVYAWGSNDHGELGIGQTGADQRLPVLVQLPAGVRIRKVAAGFNHVLAVSTTGQVYAWGGNEFGQLGNGTDHSPDATPAVVRVLDGVRVVAASAGEFSSLVVTVRGRVLGWGDETGGGLGDGQGSGFTTLPVRSLLPPGVRVRSVFSGCFHTLALTTAGTVFAFGPNGDGQLGTGDTHPSLTPVRTRLPAGTRVVAVGGGCVHSLAVTSRGQLLAWGSGGLLGNGNPADSTLPVPVRLQAGQFAIGTGGNAAGTFSLAVVLRLPVR